MNDPRVANLNDHRSAAAAMNGGVVLGREYRVTIDRKHQEAMKMMAGFVGVSEHDWLHNAVNWAIEKAYYEWSCAIAVATFLMRGFTC